MRRRDDFLARMTTAPVTEAVQAWRRRAYSVAALRATARSVLPRPIFDFADGGAEDERTLRRNETASPSFGLLPRPLRGAREPRSLDRALRQAPEPAGADRADRALPACSGRRANAPRRARRPPPAPSIARAMPRSCASRRSLLAARRRAGCRSSSISDRGFTRSFAERAAAAAYDALVLTIDNQLTGNRERDLRNGFTIPPRFGPWRSPQWR